MLESFTISIKKKKALEIIEKYFPNLTEKQKEQFGMLQELYTEWNEKVNVISRKDVENLYTKHVLHSLGIAKVLSFKSMTSILDVGTGGGFPGIPLAILFPDVSFFLVDSIGKKIKVVKDIAEKLGLENVRAEQCRAEKVKEDFDFVVARAVTDIKKFHPWVRNKISTNSFHKYKNGILYLKGGDLKEEFKEFKRNYRFYDLSKYFEEEFFETKKVVYVSA